MTFKAMEPCSVAFLFVHLRLSRKLSGSPPPPAEDKAHISRWRECPQGEGGLRKSLLKLPSIPHAPRGIPSLNTLKGI